MDTVKIGLFIAELRKSHQLTQKELAEKLNVSDKAVSKWERGLSCPDIALLSPLAEIFDVTTTELLGGAHSDTKPISVDEIVVSALEYGDKSARRRFEVNQSIIAVVFSALILIGIFVVNIVDLAVSGTLTWSLIPILCCVFGWALFFPVIRFGRSGIAATLIVLTVLVIPFLYALDLVVDRLLGTETMTFDIGIRIAPLSLVFIWICYILIVKLKNKKLLAASLITLLVSPFSYFTNTMIDNMLGQPFDLLVTLLNVLTPVVVAVVLFVLHVTYRRK